ncbi:GEVED domain-containing protein [Aquimarina sp. 2201CG1-2-11]|uniref:GEVED domain-containing protein n=1 Tax=Aquimarina discodermiae TaxID=3231043 RepID=UPI003461ABF9
MKKTKNAILLGIGVLGLSIFSTLKTANKKDVQVNTADEIACIREQHMEYLNNSPYKDIKNLSKKERRALRLPPDRYYEQLWELSMNPATGRPEPEKLTALRKQLGKRTAQRVPGEANNPWVERGPNNVGGRTRALLFDPNDNTNRRVFSGGVSGGLWVNNDITNANSQWARVQGVPGNLNVTSITVDPRNNNNWYLGTGEHYTFGDVVGNGVYRSTNGGTTWQAVNIPPAGGGNINQAVDNLFLSGIYYVNKVVAWNNTAQNRTELFVGVGAHDHKTSVNPSNILGPQSAGLYRSIDNGQTWNRIETANMRFTNTNRTYFYIPNDFEIGADNRLWMSTISHFHFNEEGGGRIFSTTNGTTWTEAGVSPIENSDRVELEASATDRNKLYALVGGVTTATIPVSIFSTSDGFATATRTSLPNDADNDINANDFTRGQAFYDLMIEADPGNDDIVYVGGIDLFRSTNSGGSWTQISKWSNNNNLAALNVPTVHADHHAMTFRPGNNNQAIFGTDGGVYYSNSLSTAQSNTNSIQSRNTGYNVTQFVKASVGPESAGSQDILLLAGSQDNGTQIFRDPVAGINSSEEISGGDGFYNFIDTDGEFLITSFSGLTATRFNLPWNGVDRGTSILNFTGGPFLPPMGYDSGANLLLVDASGGGQFLIFTVDATSNTAADLQDRITNALLDAAPTAFTPSPFANNTWLVGLANGNLLRLTNVGVRTANWANINTPFVGSISSIRFGATANDIMVTIHNYGVTSVWATTNGGANWVNKEGNLPDMPVRDILQNPLDRTEVILATQLGVWRTNNFNANNPNWVRSQNGMSDVSVTSFDYWAVNGNNNNNTVIASTYGRGIFTGSFTANGVADTQAPTVPQNLRSSNVTQTSVSLAWNASQDNVGVTGYDILQNGVVIRQNLNATNFQVTGLASGIQFRFNVRARDAVGNRSANSNTIQVRTLGEVAYCAVTGNVNDEFISNVTVGSVNNTSQGSNNGYGDFTAMRTNLSKGNSSTVSITPTWTGRTFSERYSVWIDYNQNGNFTDAGEQVFTQGGTTNSPVSGQFTVPNSATNGATRMRVIMSGNDITSPCDNLRFGEIEDYTVNITGGIVTPTPTCTDNIQNGNETGVDCGGPTCPPCATNNDGVVFVNMTDITVSASNTWGPFRIEVGDNNSFGAWISGGQLRFVSRENDLVVVGSTDNIALIRAGVQVGATSNFNSNANNSLLGTDWNGQSGFIGFRFLNGGNTHYGWFHVTVTNNGSGYTITDYAYNSNANQPLTTVVRNSQNTAAKEEIVSDVSISPNPFKNSFEINTASINSNNFSVKVYDIRGKLLVNKRYDNNPNKIVIGDQIRTQGSYFVQINTDRDSKTLKVIKL